MKPFPSGLGVALVTPFTKSGEVDFAALDTLVDYVITGGVDYLLALGTTAETPTLSVEECDAVIARIKARNAGRLPLVVGIGGNNTAAVVAAVRSFDLSGVEAVLSVTPYYNKPTQQGLYEHFKAIAAASPRPIILYNIPGRTGVNMIPSTTLRLAREFENIIGIKEACGDLVQIGEIIEGRPAGFFVLSGDDAMAIPLIEQGGDGLISVAANAYPRHISEMIYASMSQNKEKSAALWSKIADIEKALFAEGNPTGIKAALGIKGVINNVLRLPLVKATPELQGRIESLNASAGL